LYVIESKERDGLVKIGFTSTEVRERVESYREGLSDPSLIHETSGNITFERYLHTFLSKYRKQIPITFKLSDEHLPGPREWFHLDSHVLTAILKAFDQKEHPISVEEVGADDLPIFLSGVFSAIQWDAWFPNPDRLVEFTSQEEFVTPFDMVYRQWTTDDNLATYTAQPHMGEERLQSPIGTRLIQQENDVIGQVAALKMRATRIQEMEAGRTVIALAALPCILFLMATGAWMAGNIFAFGVCLLIAAWPHVQPHIAAQAVNLWRWLQTTAERSRARAGKRYE
jgi:hypothetical protein